MKEVLRLLSLFLLNLLDGCSLPDDGLMFLLVLADVLVDLEESFNLDESAFLQQVQLRAVSLGANLDVLQGRDLLLVAVLVLLGGTDGEWEPCESTAVVVLYYVSVHCYETSHCEIVVSCHNL